MTIPHILLNTPTYGYSRLKGIFKHGINYAHYDEIVETCHNKTVGNLPKEILKQIITCNPENKGEAIKSAQTAFKNAAGILSDIMSLKFEAVERFKATPKNCVKIIDTLKNLQVFLNCCEDDILLFQRVDSQNKAGKLLTRNLKKVIPNLDSVKIDYIGSGRFSDAYICKFNSKNNEQLFPDMVIKTYKDISKNFEFNVFNKCSQIMESVELEDILDYAKRYDIEVSELDINKTRNILCTMADELYTLGVIPEHGAFSEANTATYLKYVSGHKIQMREGIVIPDMFILSEKPFSIAKYVPNGAKAKRHFPLKRFDLIHTDRNFDNVKGEIVLDIGGIVPKSRNIVGNIECTRLLKGYLNIEDDKSRIEYLKDLEKQVPTIKDEILKRKYIDTIKYIRLNYPICLS